MDEALVALAKEGIHLDAMRLRAFPFPASVNEFIATPRPCVRGRAEPRRADAHAADQRTRDRPGLADRRAALRRHADHRALHHRGHHQARARAGRCSRAAREYEAPTLTFVRCPGTRRGPSWPMGRVSLGAARRETRYDLHRQAPTAPPDADAQQGRLHAARLRRQGVHAVRRLRARLDLRGDRAGLLGARHRAAPRGQAVGHRLQLEDAGLLSRRQPRLQHRARPHAQRAHRRQSGQSRAAVPGRLGRRRFGLDRPGPVRPRDAARRAHGLHRREQRRLRPDEGPVLGHRRPRQQEQEGRHQCREPGRPDRHRAAARCHLRRPRLLRRQGAAGAVDQGRHQPRRRRVPGHHQPLRGIQQPCRQHAQLRLRARAQRGREPHRLHRPGAGSEGRSRRPARPSTCRRPTAR